MEIETQRLTLRPLKISDSESIAENANNLEVSKWLFLLPYPYTVKDAESWIKETIEKWKKEKKESYDFGIELKETKQVIGGCGFGSVNGYSATVGYWIGEKYHRKGLGSEMLKALPEFAFNELKLKRIKATVFPGNPSSGKLLEKFGFEKEGLARKSKVCKADGKVKDEIIYGLLREEFKSG